MLSPVHALVSAMDLCSIQRSIKWVENRFMRRENPPDDVDVVVIGAGPGGYVSAIRAGQLGLDVALVDKEYGGTCLNRGCIPSKALISATDTAHSAKHAEHMGIDAEVNVDMARLIDWKDGVVSQLTNGVEKLCKANKVALIDGYAEFEDEETVNIDLADGGSHILSFNKAILSTGSRPLEIPGFEYADAPILSSTDALSLREIPDSLAIIGAGYIGMELAGVFAKLGTNVTVLEMLDSVMPGFDTDLVRPVKKHAQSLGVEFRLGEAAKEWHETTEGVEVTTKRESDGTSSYEADRVLVAVGREPVTDTVGLENTGIEPSDRGFIDTDEQTRTAVDNIFAVGDIVGEPMLAHKASTEGAVAAEVIAGRDVTIDRQAVPAAVFTEPEIATVGMSEEAASEAGHSVAVGEFPFRASGRSLTLGNTDGFIRIVADGADGRIVGGQIVGPEASELIAEIGLAVETEATLHDMASTIHTHPTLSEGVMEASENALDRAIHTLNR